MDRYAMRVDNLRENSNILNWQLTPKDDSLSALNEQKIILLFKKMILEYHEVKGFDRFSPEFRNVIESLAKKWFYQPNNFEEFSSILS